MTRKDVALTSSKPCSQCGKKMHHGYTATVAINHKGKIKAYCCSDNCTDLWTAQHHSEDKA